MSFSAQGCIIVLFVLLYYLYCIIVLFVLFPRTWVRKRVVLFGTTYVEPNYVEPAIGWNEEEFHTGVTKYGVANYEGTAHLKVMAPARPDPMHATVEEEMEDS